MKKKVISILVLFISTFAFSENVISLNVSPVNIGITGGESNDRNLAVLEYLFGFQGEYNYIFNNNVVIGAMLGTGIGFINDYREGSDAHLTATVGNISYAPEVGLRFGRSHLFTLLFQPFSFEHSFVSDGTIVDEDSDVSLDVDYSATYNTIKSGVKMNLQWGNRLCRNGFYVGLYIPWYRSITNAKYKGVKLDDETLSPPNLEGAFEFDLGYRISFVF